MKICKCLFILTILLSGCGKNDTMVELRQGMIINHSVTIKKDTFFLNGTRSISKPAIIIEGDNIVLDFNGAVLVGSTNYDQPHTFSGLGIEVRNGKNITIKNAVVKGFKIGLLATSIDSLQILDADFSYNYRQKLKSTWEKEVTEDWLSFHQNDEDQWLRYGMGVYLRHCDHALVRNLQIIQGQNGLMMSGCNHGLFYNNNISFNSGVGIGMYRSSSNKVMHNKLDWNIRGFSYGVYNRGQDSAGLLLYEQCNENTIAYNSATHSGDGFFLWAGQSTIDSGKGGCNDNVVYNNDFSYASNNGIEVTFSGHNKFYQNELRGCDYGLWGGYSYEMEIKGNKFENNNYSIAIEHGNKNTITSNRFTEDKIGIYLFARKEQPKEWYFANNRNIASREYEISNNVFSEMKEPFRINKTSDFTIKDNGFYKTNIPAFVNVKANKLMTDGTSLSAGSKADNKADKHTKEKPAYLLEPLPSLMRGLEDGNMPFLKRETLQGRPYIIIDQYGPYNFKHPALWLRKVEGSTYTFAVFGSLGNWKAIGGKGFKMMSQKMGTIPATLVLEAEENSKELSVELEYIGSAFVDEFGKYHKKGKPVKLTWRNSL